MKTYYAEIKLSASPEIQNIFLGDRSHKDFHDDT